MNTDAENQDIARAASRLTRADLEWIENHSQEPGSQDVASEDVSSQEEASPGTMFGSQEQEKPKKRKRRNIKHRWPEAGTILEADYEGVHYEAEVVAAPKYKSGKAVKILTGPAEGAVVSSMSAAMLMATRKQREEADLGRKGVSNGWEFWNVKN